MVEPVFFQLNYNLKMEYHINCIYFLLGKSINNLVIGNQLHISYLNGDLSPQEVKAKNWNGIDYSWKVFQKNPQWIKEAKELGLLVNVWTVNEPKIMQKMIDLKVDYITTDQPLILEKLLTK